MPSKSKTKGNGFERDVCKYLNELTGLNFTRVPNSGAFLGGKNQVRVEGMTDSQTLIFDGDIIVPDEWRKWSLECKFYKDISWKKLFQPEGVAQLNKWIEQSKVTSKPNWMLFFKINNCGSYIVIDTKALKNYKFKKPSCVMTYLNDYIIVDMKTFLDVNYKEIAK